MGTPVPRLLSSSPGCCWLPVIDYLLEWSVEQRTWSGEHMQHGGAKKAAEEPQRSQTCTVISLETEESAFSFPTEGHPPILCDCRKATWGGERGERVERRRRGGRTGQSLLQADVRSPPLSKIDRSTERGPAWSWRRSTGSVPPAFTLFLFYSTFMWCLFFLCAAVYCLMIHNPPQSELHSVAALRWSAGHEAGHPVISEKG